MPKKSIVNTYNTLKVDSDGDGRRSKMVTNSKSQMAYPGADGNFPAVLETAYSMKGLTIIYQF